MQNIESNTVVVDREAMDFGFELDRQGIPVPPTQILRDYINKVKAGAFGDTRAELAELVRLASEHGEASFNIGAYWVMQVGQSFSIMAPHAALNHWQQEPADLWRANYKRALKLKPRTDEDAQMLEQSFCSIDSEEGVAQRIAIEKERKALVVDALKKNFDAEVTLDTYGFCNDCVLCGADKGDGSHVCDQCWREVLSS